MSDQPTDKEMQDAALAKQAVEKVKELEDALAKKDKEMKDALARKDKEKEDAVDKARYETYMWERNEMRRFARGRCTQSSWCFPLE